MTVVFNSSTILLRVPGSGPFVSGNKILRRSSIPLQLLTGSYTAEYQFRSRGLFSREYHLTYRKPYPCRSL